MNDNNFTVVDVYKYVNKIKEDANRDSTVYKVLSDICKYIETNMNIIHGPGIQIYATERAPIPPYFKSGNDDADWDWDPNLQTYRKLKDILEEERIGGNNNE